jgi:hypothetical protein
MGIFPAEIVLVDCVGDVEVVGVGLDGEECLGIDLENLEGGVNLEPGGNRA